MGRVLDFQKQFLLQNTDAVENGDEEETLLSKEFQ